MTFNISFQLCKKYIFINCHLVSVVIITASNTRYQCIGEECVQQVCDDDSCSYTGGYCIGELCLKITNYFTYTDQLNNVDDYSGNTIFSIIA